MIVRDEREHLSELLPTLTSVADDVVVVDTGSSDGTPELAREAGARVFTETWQDDFALARNRGLAEVRTSHVMWIDADDRIDAEDLRRVREEALTRGRVGLMLLLVNEDRDPNAVASCWQLRVFPTDPAHRFEGRVHEQVRTSLDGTGTPVESLDVTVRHTGYVDPATVVRKARRNLELLRREVRDGRDRDITVLYHYVKGAMRTGDLDEAADVARRCVESPPADATPDVLQAIALLLARIEMQRGREEEAQRLLREAVDRQPDDPMARFFLGELLRRQGDLPAALRELQTARLSPMRQTTLPLPVAGLSRAIRLHLGEILEMYGQHVDAVAAYREILSDRPGDVPVVLALARALLGSGSLDQAELALDEVAASGMEETGEILLLRATLAFNRGQDEAAEALYAQVAEKMPRAWAAPLHRGHIALRNRRLQEALGHYEQALELADTPEVRVGLAAAQLESGALTEALGQLAHVVEQCEGRPFPPGTEALTGEALLRLGRPQEALEALERHLRRFGPDPRIVSRVADCYRELGATSAARVGYNEALRLLPGLPEAQAGLAELETVH
jgi:tetratricopeptide (TPR) repeat protein